MAATRRLAAIMFTDTVGYTESTQADEAGTLASLREQRKLLAPLIANHQGREVKSTGDGFLVEFESALQATQCAIEIQRQLREKNALSDQHPIRIRIGVHLGDVEEQGTDILGDAVNIAARIEPMAEPGGVCVSGAVREQVWNKIRDPLEKLPPKMLKGVQLPIDIYRVLLPIEAARGPGAVVPTGIAILPFSNISPEADDEYFADGLTEEVIATLSQLRELRVISRTSVMQYKSTTKAAAQIGSELGVSSLLEGSVRKSGHRVRITAQLIDARSDAHLWAATYDRELDDIFAVQAELAKQVASALKVHLLATEEDRLEGRPRIQPDSFLAYLKGRTLLYREDQASLEEARRLFERAISLDPKNAPALAGEAEATCMLGWWFPEFAGANWKEESRRLTERSIELDPGLAEAHAALSWVLGAVEDYIGSEREVRLALALNPSDALARHGYAVLLVQQGRGEEALPHFARAERDNPLWAFNLWKFAQLLVWLGKLDEALPKIERLRELDSDGNAYHRALAEYKFAKADLGGAVEELRRVVANISEDSRKFPVRAWILALEGKNEEARAQLVRGEAAQQERPSGGWTYVLAYSELGDLDESFRWLEISEGWEVARFHPRLKKLRDDPRFQPLLERHHLT